MPIDKASRVVGDAVDRKVEEHLVSFRAGCEMECKCTSPQIIIAPNRFVGLVIIMTAVQLNTEVADKDMASTLTK